MANQYLLQQRSESSITDICGINDIIETGLNANGWYCKFANGLQVMIIVDNNNFNSGQEYINKNITTPTTSIPRVGNGCGHQQSQPGNAILLLNLLIRDTYVSVYYGTIPGYPWEGYNRDTYLVLVGRWK